MIKAIIFDIGGVLQLGYYAKKPLKGHRETKVHEFMIKSLKINLDQYFDALDTAYSKSIEGKISEKKVLRIISINLKITPKKLEKLFKKAYKKNFKLNKQLFKQALNLKKKGYKIAILSDQWHLSKKSLLIKAFIKNFNPIIISCDVGVRKPDLKIYQFCLNKLKIKPSEAIFIDNQEWNLKPAKKLGMKTILYKSNEQVFKQLFKTLK